MYEVLRFGNKNEMWPKEHLFEFIIWTELRLTHSFALFFAVFDERISAIVIIYLLLLQNMDAQ